MASMLEDQVESSGLRVNLQKITSIWTL
jgi:hypothetical protein